MTEAIGSSKGFLSSLLTRADRGESVQGNPLPLELQRRPGENRATHRARLKRERRASKVK